MDKIDHIDVEGIKNMYCMCIWPYSCLVAGPEVFEDMKEGLLGNKSNLLHIFFYKDHFIPLYHHSSFPFDIFIVIVGCHCHSSLSWFEWYPKFYLVTCFMYKSGGLLAGEFALLMIFEFTSWFRNRLPNTQPIYIQWWIPFYIIYMFLFVFLKTLGSVGHSFR